MKKFAFLAALMALTAAGTAHAEERRILVSATGTVQAEPDMATITLGVTNEDVQAATAMQATSDAVSKILTRLEQMGVEPRDVQTRDLSLNPVWSRLGNDKDGQREITGFAASNRVLVRVRNLDQLGGIMDAVIQDGANDFGGLSFGLQDSTPIQAEARAKAVTEATAKAQQLAQAADVALGDVHQISEQSGGVRPVAQMREFAVADSNSVPVAGGEVAVSVSVSMEFDIAE